MENNKQLNEEKEYIYKFTNRANAKMFVDTYGGKIERAEQTGINSDGMFKFVVRLKESVY